MLRPQGRTLLLALHPGAAAGPLGAGLWGLEGWTQGQGIQLAPHVSPTALPTPPPAGGGGTSLPSPAASGVPSFVQLQSPIGCREWGGAEARLPLGPPIPTQSHKGTTTTAFLPPSYARRSSPSCPAAGVPPK